MFLKRVFYFSAMNGAITRAATARLNGMMYFFMKNILHSTDISVYFLLQDVYYRIMV